MISSVAVLVLATSYLLGSDVTSWSPVLWFLAGPASCMAMFVGMNLHMQFKAAVAIWFAAEWIADGGDLLSILIPVIVGMAAFLLANRIQQIVDLSDLLTCLFDREIGQRNPEFHDPDKRHSIGSGEFILRRLELPVWRLFSTSTLSRIFVSHRNSEAGIHVATVLHDELSKTGNWSVYLDRKHLSGGLWRDQLADGFRARGVVLCVLTPDDREKLRWVRRELYAASLLYKAYGYPIPIIIEAGFTLEELLAYEETHGRSETPLHKVRKKLVRVQWETDQNDEQFVARLSETIQKTIAREAHSHTPFVLTDGITGLAAQFVKMSILITSLAAFGYGSSSPAFKLVLIAACFVLAMDFGGTSIYRLLPAWAGGERRADSWMRPMTRQLRHPLEFLAITITTFLAMFRQDFEPNILVAVLLGISFNAIDHELWLSRRLADGVLHPDDLEPKAET